MTEEEFRKARASVLAEMGVSEADATHMTSEGLAHMGRLAIERRGAPPVDPMSSFRQIYENWTTDHD